MYTDNSTETCHNLRWTWLVNIDHFHTHLFEYLDFIQKELIRSFKKARGIMQTELLGILFEQLTLSEAASQVVEAGRHTQKGLVVTPNVDHVVMLQDDAEMRKIYQGALFRYADGMPLVWLSRLVTTTPLPERVTGADLITSVCEKAAECGLNIYFLGGNPGVAEKAAKKLQNLFNGLKIVGTYCPPFGFEKNAIETDRIIADINARNVDILFIGVGAPKQEKWAAAHLDRLEVGPILCVGAAFDFAAGIIKRAPIAIQKSGFEWVWRLACEPTRLWRRYLIRDSRFISLALNEMLIALKKRFYVKR